MIAYVYKSLRAADTYLYLRRREDFDCLPAALRARLGTLIPVLEVDLVPGRRLAREDADRVLAALGERGYHLQLPPPLATPAPGVAD